MRAPSSYLTKNYIISMYIEQFYPDSEEHEDLMVSQ